MAKVWVGGEYIDYGSLMNYTYYVEGKKVHYSKDIQFAIHSKLQIQRRATFVKNGLIEQYNHDKKIFEPVEG